MFSTGFSCFTLCEICGRWKPCTRRRVPAQAHPTLTIKTGLSDFEIRLCVYELLRALAWTHARGVMHRDVKNKNVLVDRRTRALRCVQRLRPLPRPLSFVSLYSFTHPTN